MADYVDSTFLISTIVDYGLCGLYVGGVDRTFFIAILQLCNTQDCYIPCH